MNKIESSGFVIGKIPDKKDLTNGKVKVLVCALYENGHISFIWGDAVDKDFDILAEDKKGARDFNEIVQCAVYKLEKLIQRSF